MTARTSSIRCSSVGIDRRNLICPLATRLKSRTTATQRGIAPARTTGYWTFVSHLAILLAPTYTSSRPVHLRRRYADRCRLRHEEEWRQDLTRPVNSVGERSRRFF